MIAAIVNPAAGSGSARRRWRLAKRFGPTQVLFTERAGHATELASRLADAGCEMIIVAGGDGTLNEVVNGVVGRASGLPRIALLPLGSGGDFARTLGVEERCVDVFRARFREGERYFVNVCSLGLGAVAARGVRWLRGSARYFAALIPPLAAGRSFAVKLWVDDQCVGEFEITTAAVANGQYHGGGIRIAPEAAIDDGLADITIVERVSLFEVARHLPILYNGTIYTHPRVRRLRGARVRAESAGVVPVEMDGEVVGSLPTEIEVLPRALRIALVG